MTRNASAKHMAAQQGSRVHIFDAARGFSVVSMVLFHYCYDLKFISGVPLEWFAPPLQDIWRASISWAFLFIAGCMCAHSRGNLRRGGIYMAFALLIFVVTTIAAVDVPISFGIIFCMAACTLLEWVLEKMRLSPNGYAAAVILFVVFLLLLGVPQGRVGVAGLSVAVPRALYGSDYLSWLGFPGPTFASGDYYPLIPYFFMYLTGTACGRHWKQLGYPTWAYGKICRPLEFIGRHALEVYVLHQPLLLLLTGNFL